MFRCASAVAVLAQLLVCSVCLGQGPPHSWSKRFGDLSEFGAPQVAIDASENVLLAGRLCGSLDFGGGPLVSQGCSNIFLVKFDTGGSHVWSQGFGYWHDLSWEHADWAADIAVDPWGDIVLTGAFRDSIDFGGGRLDGVDNDIFLVKFDPSGAHVWSHRFGGLDEDRGMGLAADDWGTIVLTGSFSTTVNFGGWPLVSAGGRDIFLARFAGDGSHLWSQRFGEGGDEEGMSVAVDGWGNVVLSGGFSGTVDFGGGPLVSSGGPNVFLAKFDPSGTHLWSYGYTAYHGRVTVDGSGNPILAGYFCDRVDFGGGPLVSEGSWDVFLAKFAPDGAHLWSQRFGDGSGQGAYGVATDDSGNVLLLTTA